MIDDLQKAGEFYLKYLEVHQGLKINTKERGNGIPDREESLAFKAAFKDLDETEQEQWFDHHYHQAINSVFGDGQSSHLKGRESLLLLLKVYTLFKMKLTRKYEFGKLIHACWIKNPVKLTYIRDEINEIFDSCNFNVERPSLERKNKVGCGCLARQTCDIF